MSTLASVSNDEYAAILAERHFELDGDLERIVQLDSDREDTADEPLKLLEVNRDVFPIGAIPVYFRSRVEDSNWYPPVVIYEVTPEEYRQIREGQLPIRHGNRIRREFLRPGA